MFVDNQLSWKEHIQYIYKKLLKFVSIFYKLQYKLSLEVLKMLYFSFIHPHLYYGIELYGNTNKTSLKPLMTLNKILRILQHKPYWTCTAALYKRFNTLPISAFHTYQLLLLVHKFVHHRGKLPSAFSQYFIHNYEVHNYSTRRQNDLYLQRLRTTRGKRLIKFKASHLWNDLPNNLKQIQSLNLFKHEFKKFCLSKLWFKYFMNTKYSGVISNW